MPWCISRAPSIQALICVGGDRDDEGHSVELGMDANQELLRSIVEFADSLIGIAEMKTAALTSRTFASYLVGPVGGTLAAADAEGFGVLGPMTSTIGFAIGG